MGDSVNPEAAPAVTGLPPSNGHIEGRRDTRITIVDCFSKAAHFVPLSKLLSAAETGDQVVHYVRSDLL